MKKLEKHELPESLGEVFQRELKKIPERHPFHQIVLDDIPTELMTPKFWKGVKKEIEKLNKLNEESLSKKEIKQLNSERQYITLEEAKKELNINNDDEDDD